MATQTETLLEEVKAKVAAGCDASERELARQFVHAFYANARADLFRRRDASALAETALGAFRFLQRAPADRVTVEVTSSTESGDPAAGPVTIIRTHVTDRPFVVDTIREYLASCEIDIRWFIYPVLRVARDASQRVVELGRAVEAGPRESLTHCEVHYIGSTEQQDAIAAELRRSLEDVVRATDDFKAMIEAAHDTISYLEERAKRLPDRAHEIGEIEEFMRWLVDGGFVFLGFRTYSIVDVDGERAAMVDAGSGLGILRDESRSSFARPVPLATFTKGLRDRVESAPLLITSKTNAPSTVHRRTRMDYIGVKKVDDAGRITGERRFIGLFTSKANAEDAERIPILREKLRTIVSGAGAISGTHDYKEIITIFNSMPKEELFFTSAREIGDEIRTVLQLYHTHEVRVTLNPDPLERGVAVMVILPKTSFSGAVRKSIEDMLLDTFGGTILNYHLALGGGEQARLHFHVGTTPERVAGVDAEAIEHRIRMLIRTWSERVRLELERDVPPDLARRLAEQYGAGFSAEYQAATAPGIARADILQLEAMAAAGDRVGVRLFTTEPPDPSRVVARYTHLKLYLIGERLVLSEFMPILENAGLRVLFVRPFELTGADGQRSTIYLFAVQDSEGQPIDVERQADLLADVLLAVRAGDATSDELNQLVLRADLPWRAVDLLRAYCEYAFQIGAVPSRRALVTALTTHAESAALLIRLFTVKFDPASGLAGTERTAQAERIRNEFIASLSNVLSLTEDRALRQLLGLVDATVRTNFYRHGGITPTFRSGGVPYISLKFSGAAMQATTRSGLLFEVWVQSSRMAGVHLRTARVARGGIRLSDRPDDFRTEVLGLVRTQALKNAVIVPGGSKGGFIAPLAPADPAARAEEVTEQYRTLMRGLLDVTDNLIDGETHLPAGVIAHDEPDPYLVIAADKGTAHLSDVANAIADEYGFWLADAFASGGSNGYDHKALGITAKGAWECVRRHFREMEHDTQTQPFTVVGIGDMSGDVFGNGMLLSRQIRLIAAFDHRHIMVDPDPDPETSWRERERLFHAGRTSWDDYDRAVLGEGGFIVSRGSKSVPLTGPARKALGLPDAVTELDGESLIRAVLCAPADLLWNGGIGTYVKATDERHGDVGDPTSDAVRVDARDLRVRVIGEGGNLGLTQAARVEYALRGGRLNTDAVDNAGGVDLSDHEVNLKILLNAAVDAGALTRGGRNELIEALAPEVMELTLRDVRSQSLAISLDERRAEESIDEFHSLMQHLERVGLLDRAAEKLPTQEVLLERRARGGALTRPELSILLAWFKLWLKRQLLASDVPDDPAAETYLYAYFPPTAQRVAGLDALRGHRLSREIIVTQLVNDMVDLMGVTFLFRVLRDTGEAPSVIARSWLIASRLCGARELREALTRIENDLLAPALHFWARGLEHVLERTTRWLLVNVSAQTPTAVTIAEHEPGLEQLRRHFIDGLPRDDRALIESRIDELRQLTDEEELAARLTTLRYVDEFLEIVHVARDAGVDPGRAATAYYAIAELLELTWLKQAVTESAKTRWDHRLATALLDELGRAHRSLTTAAAGIGATDSIDDMIAQLSQRMAADSEQFRALIAEIRTDAAPPLTAVAFAIRELRNISTRIAADASTLTG